MADDILDAQSTAEDASETNAAAVALALDGASTRPELSGAIAAFLKEQGRLMEEQREQLRDQVKRIRLGIIDQRFSIALKAMTALVGVAVATFFAAMVWNAAGSGGLIIEPFSVPPDLAARGVTSEVVAAKLLDQLTQMQNETNSQRAPQTFQNYWGQDIKVMIPDTGVSFGELDRFLNLKLGHATHVSGEIVHTVSGVAITARTGPNGSGTVNGSENTLGPLMHDLAEQVYRLTQPYLYGAWLQDFGRTKDALPVFVTLATNGPVQERGWGYLGWSNCLELTDGETARLAMLLRGVKSDPRLFIVRQNIALSEDELSRPEQAIADAGKALVLLDTPRKWRDSQQHRAEFANPSAIRHRGKFGRLPQRRGTAHQRFQRGQFRHFHLQRCRAGVPVVRRRARPEKRTFRRCDALAGRECVQSIDQERG
ncbi:MAG: hypothetical protein WDM89_20625 [Rhizomicrobium sp.]